MKTSVGTVVLLGAALTAGLALAQTPPQPRGDRARAEPEGAAGETRAQINQSGAVIAAERRVTPATAGVTPTAAPNCDANTTHADTGDARSGGVVLTPVIISGGTGGGRSSNRDHIDQDAQVAIGAGRSSADTGPVNGIGGTGGGRYTFVPTTRARIINNSETDTAEVDGAAARLGTGAGGAASFTPCAPTPTARR